MAYIGYKKRSKKRTKKGKEGIKVDPPANPNASPKYSPPKSKSVSVSVRGNKKRVSGSVSASKPVGNRFVLKGSVNASTGGKPSGRFGVAYKFKRGGKVARADAKAAKKEKKASVTSAKKAAIKTYGRKNVRVTKGKTKNPAKWNVVSNKSGSKKKKNVSPTGSKPRKKGGHVVKKYERKIVSVRKGATPRKRASQPMFPS